MRNYSQAKDTKELNRMFVEDIRHATTREERRELEKAHAENFMRIYFREMEEAED